MKIKLNIDRTVYKTKDAAKQHIGSVKNKVGAGSTEIEASELIALVESGGSFAPALLNGTEAKNWQSQQVIIADIDNDEKERDEKGDLIKDENGKNRKVPVKFQLSSAYAAEICKAHGITPFFMYHTFSNGKVVDGVSIEKYRIIIVLDKPITEATEANELTARFADIFNKAAPGAADVSIKNLDRVVFGSNKGSAFNITEAITPLEVVRELPEIQPEKTATEPRQEPAKYEAPRKDRRYDDIKEQRRYDIENFDLESYILSTEPGTRVNCVGNQRYINPCPLCGHTDDFRISGHIFKPFCMDEGDGGTIIDYLMYRENKTLQEALKKFDSMMNYEEPTPEPIKEDPAPEQEAAKDNRDDLTKFFETIQTEAYKPHPTGLKFFDNLLDGGIVNQSLLLLLAAPAAGKTTLVQQIAEEMAKNKNPIIYINFEMSREQMLAKAISAKYYRNGGNKTALGVLRGYEWSDDDRDGLAMIVDEYRRNNYPYIRYNPDGVTSEIHALLKYLTAIGNAANKAGQQAPAIVVDYLHLITSNEKTDDAELIKQTVIGLKDYAKNYNTFVIGIIASNRASNKSGRLTMESGRDSSNLEYTGDYILSLNYEEIDNGTIKPNSTKDDINEKLENLYNREKRPMILRVLKNRFGQQGKSRKLLFNAPYNIFYDGDDKAIPPAGFILDDGAPAFDS